MEKNIKEARKTKLAEVTQKGIMELHETQLPPDDKNSIEHVHLFE